MTIERPERPMRDQQNCPKVFEQICSKIMAVIQGKKHLSIRSRIRYICEGNVQAVTTMNKPQSQNMADKNVSFSGS
jgi:hypothetical protein